jgi:uncharacterized repeat protein (TIGR01451 family)
VSELQSTPQSSFGAGRLFRRVALTGVALIGAVVSVILPSATDAAAVGPGELAVTVSSNYGTGVFTFQASCSSITSPGTVIGPTAPITVTVSAGAPVTLVVLSGIPTGSGCNALGLSATPVGGGPNYDVPGFQLGIVGAAGGTIPLPFVARATDLAVTKTLTPNPLPAAAAGSAATPASFAVTVTNVSMYPANRIEVTDLIPSELTVVSVSTSTGSWSAPTWSFGFSSLNPGKSATMTVNVLVPWNVGTAYPVTPPVTNCASVSILPTGSAVDINSSNNQACRTVIRTNLVNP